MGTGRWAGQPGTVGVTLARSLAKSTKRKQKKKGKQAGKFKCAVKNPEYPD